MEKIEHLHIAGGNAKWYNHFGNSWTVSFKIEQALLFDPEIPLLGIYVTKRNDNLCSHKNLRANIYSTFVHNCPKLEVTQMSFNGRIDK